MSFITIEDCSKYIKNRFELVVLASQRAKSIASGTEPNIERNSNKNVVIALYEISTGNIDINYLRDNQIQNLQKTNKIEDEVHEENLYAEIKDHIENINKS